MMIRIAVAVALLALIVAPASAANRPASLRGVCTIAGKPVSDALVQVFAATAADASDLQLDAFPGTRLTPQTRPDGTSLRSALFTATTGDNGVWWFPRIPGGRYLITAQALGAGGSAVFSSSSVITLKARQRRVADVPLRVAVSFAAPPRPQVTERLTYFVTDREPEPDNEASGAFATDHYANQRSTDGRLRFGSCSIELHGERRAFCHEKPQKTVVAELERAASSSADSGIIYIHGFNQSFADALRTANVLSEVLKQTVFVYDWASLKRSDALSYHGDEDNLAASLVRGKPLLLALLHDPRMSSVTLVAHSMGSRAIVELANAADSDTQVKHVVFAAADIYLDMVRLSLTNLRRFAGSVQSYASGYDSALILSNMDHAGHARLGESARSAADLDGVISIDATLDDKLSLSDPFGHGYFQTPLILDDIDQFLASVPLDRRAHLARSSPPAPFYYLFTGK